MAACIIGDKEIVYVDKDGNTIKGENPRYVETVSIKRNLTTKEIERRTRFEIADNFVNVACEINDEYGHRTEPRTIKKISDDQRESAATDYFRKAIESLEKPIITDGRNS